jgi:alpha-beta hydrolase superfamily lysophospholipase
MDEAQPIIELIDELGQPVHIVGHSYGGAASLSRLLRSALGTWRAWRSRFLILAALASMQADRFVGSCSAPWSA